MGRYLLTFEGKGRIMELSKHQAENGAFAADLMHNFAAEITGRKDRLDFARLSRLHDDQVVMGVPYLCGADSRAGAWFELIAMPDMPPEQIADAAKVLLKNRDVASLSITRITQLM